LNKTIYIPDDEAETWEKARRLAGDRLSPVIVKAVKEFVAGKEAALAGYERIQVEYDDHDDNFLPKAKAFHGKWIFSPDQPLKNSNEEGTISESYCVAVTAKGKVVVYTWRLELETKGENAGEVYASGRRFLVFSSFGEAANDPDINYAVRQALKKRGVPVEELDI